MTFAVDQSRPSPVSLDRLTTQRPKGFAVKQNKTTTKNVTSFNLNINLNNSLFKWTTHDYQGRQK